MENFKKINIISGWAVFFIAAITYFLTVEPTASFWDCGEFITTSHKLEVGHPPGAPLFMLLGRFFSLFSFGDLTRVALMINAVSVLASAFTILFLFWSITHIAKRIIADNGTISNSQLITIIASGAVGALVYTFSDSFWFSAVEGEVYATSSLFTAIVFWAILKWENEAEQKYANRWLILIAYLMGLSIGIHLLNLLAIPAIGFVYYFKKYKTSRAGIIKTAIISLALLIFVMYGIIQGSVILGAWFERVFTNLFGAPYNTGFIFYLLLLFGGLIFGIYYTLKTNKVALNTVFTGLLVLLIGYSSFATIIIRSKADTPMNQNKPDNLFLLISYLNREQYGDRPLFHGQYFNAPLNRENPYEKIKANYTQKDDKYKIVDHKIGRNYIPEYTTIFPRMYSDQESPNHVRGYQYWTGTNDKDFYYPKKNEETGEFITNRNGDLVYDKYNPKRPPSFAENLRFFFSYQLNFMYFRYFMWNFAGKQNDIQGHGNVKDGNWISGIKFIDEWRLGNQDKVTTAMENNKAKNKYYFLPLILGIIGMMYMLNSNNTGKNYFWIILLFFFFTGVAIVLYLNQPPQQPRERDYAYAASFYVFSFFIGFGVAGIYKFFKKYTSQIISAGLAFGLALGVPALMAAQNWDDHDRSNRYTASDYAKNYLSSCEKNAVIFTNGDNDTFPLWYIQEVEEFRTDIRVINLSYFNTDWYINQMIKKAYESEPLPFALTPDKYEPGKRDIIYKSENPSLYINEKYNGSKYKLEQKYKKLYDTMFTVLESSNFKDIFSDEYKQLKKGHTEIKPMQFLKFIGKLSDVKTVKKAGLNYNIASMESIFKQTKELLSEISKQPLPIKTFIEHIGSDKKSLKVPMQDGEYVNYMPTTNIIIPVNKQEIIKNKVVAEKDQHKIEDAFVWNFKKNHIRKSEMMIIDLLASNNWKRPIYYATTVGRSHYMNLENYFQLEGLAYRIIPVKAGANDNVDEGRVNSDILYRNIMEKFVWGGLEKNPEKLYLDENNRRFIMNFKSSFKSLAEQLIAENKNDKAEKVLDKCFSLFTNELSTFNYYDLLMVEMYYSIGKNEKADSIIEITANNFNEDMEYYFSLDKKLLPGLTDDFGRTLMLIQETIKILKINQKNDLSNKLILSYRNQIETKFQYNSILSQLTSQQEQNRWFTNLPEYEQRLISFYMTLESFIETQPPPRKENQTQEEKETPQENK